MKNPLFDDKKHFYIPYSKLNELKLVNIGLASSEEIKKWAEKKLPNGKVLGQVTNANTLHHKTFKPLKGGLFCERIFGPMKDFECSCGKTKKFLSSLVPPIQEQRVSKENFDEKTRGNQDSLLEERVRKFCPICDVEYTWSVIRRYQLGFIQLVMPVTHLWYLKGSPSYLSLLLDMKKKKLESVVYCSENMALETIHSMIYTKSFPLFLSVLPQEKKEKNTKGFKITSSLYNSWEKILKDANSQTILSNTDVFASSKKKDRKKSDFFFSLQKNQTFQPKRLSGWRNLNFQNFHHLFEKSSLKEFRKKTISIPLKILLRLKNFQKTSNLAKCFVIHRDIEKKKIYQIAFRKAHQIILRIQAELFKKSVQESLDFTKNSHFFQTFVLNKEKQNFNEKGKQEKFQNSFVDDHQNPFHSNGQKKNHPSFNHLLFEMPIFFQKKFFSNTFSSKKIQLHKNSLELVNGFLRKENESKYFKFLKKSRLKKMTQKRKFVFHQPLSSRIHRFFSKKAKNFFSKKMIKSILMFRIRQEILNSEFKKIFSFPFSLFFKENQDVCQKNSIQMKNLIMFHEKISGFFSKGKKRGKKIFKMTEFRTFHSILEKLSFFQEKKKKVESRNLEKNQTQEFLDSMTFINQSKKEQNYSLYCLSHRFCWENEKDWSNFVYFFSAPSKIDDLPIFTYKKRISETFQGSFSGAKVIQKLLTEFHFQEFKKMDRQNRILLYELNKQIQKDSSKVQFHEKNLQPKIHLERRNWKKFCQKRDQLIRRTKFIRKLFRKNSQPESMILSVLPVLPPDLRPILKIQDQIAASDLNRLYQRVIYRNERLKKFLKDSAMNHSYEMKYAQRLLQEAVDNLLQNGKAGGTPERDSRGRLLKSLSEILKGKQGRFRQNLLGKRVDYSGRSVIVVGPQLKIHECGLPKEMALELFLPFLLKRLIHLKIARTVIGAKTILKNHSNFTWEILHEVMQNSPVLLNRAPTLHRLGIQAFQPKLIEGRAILLHPLVCPAFNADFDGDQMAVHIPLTVEARAEAWKFMCSANHFFSPATGDPLLLPSQDIVLGCYYLTTEKNQWNFQHHEWNDFKKDIHQILWIRWNGFLESVEDPEQPCEIRIDPFGNWNEIFSKSQKDFDAKGRLKSQFVRTTRGRLFFHEILQECIKK